MSIFKPVVLSFDGQDYTVKPENVLRLIAQVEDVISIADLYGKQRTPLAKLCQAYGIALRYAGCNVTDDDLYAKIFQTGSAQFTTNAISGLLMMMVPPADLVSEQPKKKPVTKKRT